MSDKYTTGVVVSKSYVTQHVMLQSVLTARMFILYFLQETTTIIKITPIYSITTYWVEYM